MAIGTKHRYLKGGVLKKKFQVKYGQIRDYLLWYFIPRYLSFRYITDPTKMKRKLDKRVQFQ